MRSNRDHGKQMRTQSGFKQSVSGDMGLSLVTNDSHKDRTAERLLRSVLGRIRENQPSGSEERCAGNYQFRAEWSTNASGRLDITLDLPQTISRNGMVALKRLAHTFGLEAAHATPRGVHFFAYQGAAA